MKNRTRLSVLLLVLCLLLCLAGCGKDVPQLPSVPETTVQPTTLPATTAAPDPADIYAAAVESLGNAVAMEIRATQAMTVAGQTFISNCSQNVEFWNVGKDAFLAKAEDTTEEEIIETLKKINYIYDENQNRFL